MKLLIWCPAQLCGRESSHAILILSLSGVNIDIMLTDAITTFLGGFLVRLWQICCSNDAINIAPKAEGYIEGTEY